MHLGGIVDKFTVAVCNTA